MQADRVLVSARVYRPLGSVIEIFSASTVFQVDDRLDRTHPFVQWTHVAITPDVIIENGVRRLTGTTSKHRISDIHRTDVPGRCRMAARFSAKAKLEYLDALPFPRSELDARRAAVCDYCFYGGPGRSIPLI